LPVKHLRVLQKQITALSDALAKLGRGTSERELSKVIRLPGWTTPAELAFAIAMLNAMRAHVAAIEALQKGMLSASKRVGR
jgi:hypothetical protein